MDSEKQIKEAFMKSILDYGRAMREQGCCQVLKDNAREPWQLHNASDMMFKEEEKANTLLTVIRTTINALALAERDEREIDEAWLVEQGFDWNENAGLYARHFEDSRKWSYWLRYFNPGVLMIETWMELHITKRYQLTDIIKSLNPTN
jgi:hypothetical protein